MFQHIGELEEKVAALESWKLHHGVHARGDIDHLEERLHQAEAELADMDRSQRSSELQENRKVLAIQCLKPIFFTVTLQQS